MYIANQQAQCSKAPGFDVSIAHKTEDNDLNEREEQPEATDLINQSVLRNRVVRQESWKSFDKNDAGVEESLVRCQKNRCWFEEQHVHAIWQEGNWMLARRHAGRIFFLLAKAGVQTYNRVRRGIVHFE